MSDAFMQALEAVSRREIELSIERKEVVTLSVPHPFLGRYFTVEGAECDLTGYYHVKLRPCGKYANFTLYAQPSEIVRLPQKLKVLDKHFP